MNKEISFSICPVINACRDMGEFLIWLVTGVGILGLHLLGPVVLPNRLTGAVYHLLLVNDLPVLLEHVPLHQRQHTGFMHYGAPPHFLRIVGQHLNQTFGEQWIGRWGPVNWSARSPDLNPLDFWLWGHLNTLVYSAPISDLVVLQQRAENVCQEIRIKPGIIRHSAQLCATKSWKFCWNAREPHRESL
jgi:hypothetical protein